MHSLERSLTSNAAVTFRLLLGRSDGGVEGGSGDPDRLRSAMRGDSCSAHTPNYLHSTSFACCIRAAKARWLALVVSCTICQCAIPASSLESYHQLIARCRRFAAAVDSLGVCTGPCRACSLSRRRLMTRTSKALTLLVGTRSRRPESFCTMTPRAWRE